MNNVYAQPLVTVAIPVRNGRNKTLNCLASLEKSNYPKLEIIVIDNGSTDGTAEAVMKAYPNVQVITNRENLYLANARNIGIECAKSEYVFLVDYDNIIDPDAITYLVETMSKDPMIGTVGPIAYYYSDPTIIWSGGSLVNHLTGHVTHVGFRKEDKGEYKTTFKVDFFPNAFMVRKSMSLKIGLFNTEKYPQAGQEPDFSRRSVLAGYQVICDPRAKVYHDVLPPSTGLAGMLRDRHFEGAPSTASPKTYFHGRNRILYQKEYAGAQFWVFLLIFQPVYMAYYTALTLLNRRPDLTKAYWHGFLDALKIVLFNAPVPRR